MGIVAESDPLSISFVIARWVCEDSEFHGFYLACEGSVDGSLASQGSDLIGLNMFRLQVLH